MKATSRKMIGEYSLHPVGASLMKRYPGVTCRLVQREGELDVVEVCRILDDGTPTDEPIGAWLLSQVVGVWVQQVLARESGS